MRFLLAVLTLMVVLITPTSAQADTCGTLSSQDCTLLLESQQVMTDLDAASFDIAFDMIVRPRLLNMPFEFNTTIVGDYVLDEKFRGTATNPVQLITNWVTGITSDVNVIITLPEELSSLGMGTIPEKPISLDLRLVDGIGYANLAKLLEISEGAAWYGVDLVEYYNEIFSLLGVGATSPLATPEGGTTGILGAVVQLGGDFTRMRDANGLTVIEGIVTGEQILSDEEQRAILELGIYAALPEYDVTDPEMREEAATTYTELVRFLTFRTERRIDPETGYMHQLAAEMTFMPDSSLELNGQNDPLGFAPLLDITMTVDFSLSIADFNDVEAANTPSDAEIIPLDEFLPADLFGLGGGI